MESDPWSEYQSNLKSNDFYLFNISLIVFHEVLGGIQRIGEKHLLYFLIFSYDNIQLFNGAADKMVFLSLIEAVSTTEEKFDKNIDTMDSCNTITGC